MSRGMLFGVMGLASLANAVGAQEARIFLHPTEATILPGRPVTFKIFVENVSKPGLRAYQVELAVVPEEETVGTLELADQVPAPANRALFVDEERPDFVFFDLNPFVGINVMALRLTAFLIYGGVSVSEPKYCGTCILRASQDTEGDFQVNLVTPGPSGGGTYLRGPGGPGDAIPATLDSAIVHVIPFDLPATSEWGVIAAVLLLANGIGIKFGRRVAPADSA